MLIEQTADILPAVGKIGEAPPSSILRVRIEARIETFAQSMRSVANKIAPNARALSERMISASAQFERLNPCVPDIAARILNSPVQRIIQQFQTMRPQYLRFADVAREAFESHHSALAQIQRVMASEHFLTTLGAQNLFSTQTIIDRYARNFSSYQLAMNAIPNGLLLNGYRFTAYAGIQGLAPKGAAADVLADYGAAASDTAPFFSAVREHIENLDVDDIPASEVEDWIAALWQNANHLLEAGGGAIKKAGLIHLLMLFLTVAQVYYAATDHTEEEVQRVAAAVEDVSQQIETSTFSQLSASSSTTRY